MLDFQDSRYTSYITRIPIPAPIEGAVYDRTLRTILSDLIRAVVDRPYMLNIEGFGLPLRLPLRLPL